MIIQLNNGTRQIVDWSWVEEQQRRSLYDTTIEGVCLGCGEVREIEVDDVCVSCPKCDDVCAVWNPLDYI